MPLAGREAEEGGLEAEGEHHVEQGRPRVERGDYPILGRLEDELAGVQRHQQEVKETRNDAAEPVDGCLAGEFAEGAQVKNFNRRDAKG